MVYIALGLDLSLVHTGWVRLGVERQDSKLKHVTPSVYVMGTGLLSSPHKGVKRLADLRTQLVKVMVERLPDVVAIEGYAYGAKTRREVLGEWGGIARLLCWDNKLPYIIIAPPSLKKFVTGKGLVKKSLILMRTALKWKMEFTDENIADAYGLARIGACWLEHSLIGQRYERDVLRKLVMMRRRIT